MDPGQLRQDDELQVLGILGIFKESFKIICKEGPKIFSQIALTLILPLSFLFLAHIEICDILVFTIIGPERRQHPYLIRREWAIYLLVKAAYLTSMCIFGLLSVSSVVYTVAGIYTSREITFRKIMSVVPKVWKRLMITFLCTFLAFVLYHIVAIVVLIIFLFVTNIPVISRIQGILFLILLILYLAGFLYLIIIWQLANVISVLEETRGFKAMTKSKKLLKGKMWVSTIIFFMLGAPAFGILIAFQILVVGGWMFGLIGMMGLGIICLLLMIMLILLLLVIQTVLYFVCKSYHHESMDKSAISNHLEVIHLGRYVPSKSNDVQLEQV